jgi:hypothetical protein
MIDKQKVTFSAFYERYCEFSDDRILEILHNQKDYQDVALDAAVKIAIERKLIYSELELMAPEFQNSRNTKRSFFPHISDPYHQRRLTASTFRFLKVLSFLPLVYGIFEYTKGEIPYAIGTITVAVAWFLSVFFMKKTEKTILFIPLIALMTCAGGFAAYKIFSVHPVKVLDLVMLVVTLLFTLYFILFAKKLMSTDHS